jgi:predicted lipoprotein with Yx(FWY)xxD motif
MGLVQRDVRSQDPQAGVRKVTYSLPARLVAELDQRTADAEKTKSAVVAEALTLYFAELDREALSTVYQEAAQDPLFLADNESVQRDFAALDAEVEREIG